MNLIGEHTDYNAGWALPCAIQLGCTANITPRPDGAVEVRSTGRPDVVRIESDALRPGTGDWAGYAFGVVWTLRDQGIDVPGLDIALDSDVPLGSGLSSSAAVVCSVVTAVDDLLDLQLDADSLLDVSRRAENDFVGAPTGGMDQLASLRSEVGHALLCDMRALSTTAVPVDLPAHDLLVVDTRAPHRHADGEYRRRREGCERAARELGVEALRDVTDLDAIATLDDEAARYTRHVVTENARVLQAVDALRAADAAALGELFTASHVSMRDDFRITVPEIDLAAESLLAAGALGSRMTGGGFGGCVIGIVPTGRRDDALDAVRAAFAEHGFSAPDAFVAEASAGAHPVD